MMKMDYTAGSAGEIDEVLAMMRFIAEDAVKYGPVSLAVEVKTA